MTTVFTLSEVGKHNSVKDCWLAIGGKVYDVSKFLSDHPGGQDVVLLSTGRDATVDFGGVNHSDDAQNLMSRMKIGVLESSIRTKLKQDDLKYSGDKSGSFVTRVLQILCPLAILALALAYRFPNVREALGPVS